MPATFTHFMVVEKALDRYLSLRRNNDPGAVLIQRHFPFALQGAIGPDYPFLEERLPIVGAPGDWGARMHFENTGRVVDCGLDLLDVREGITRDICTAWLFGFASHLIADSIMHPVVNLAVGGIAQFTERDHGECEITQDSWLYYRLNTADIRECRYADQLRDCSDSDDPHRIHPAIRSFWTESLRAAHPSAPQTALDALRPDKWHEGLLTFLPWSANPTPFARHAAKAVGQSHRVYTEAAHLNPAEVERYVFQLRLPATIGDPNAPPLLRAFHHIVAEVATVWAQLADALNEPQRRRPFRNCDLDTGVEVPRWDATATTFPALALWPGQGGVAHEARA